MTSRVPLAILCCGLLSGCQHQAPPNLTGTYTGTLESSSGVATVTVRLSEVQGALSGTAQGSGLGFMQQQYYVTGGHHDDGSVDLDIALSWQTETSSEAWVGPCAYRLNGGGDASALAGTYFTHSCAAGGGSTGTFTLGRQ